jgi:pyrimidine-nucleoside phosphorylase
VKIVLRKAKPHRIDIHGKGFLVNIVDILDKKRRGQSHTETEIKFLVESLMAGSTKDYQVSAWLMAACLQGLNLDETTWLTKAFVDSGNTLNLSQIGGFVVDKHSTGGVGDNTSLVLVPLLAASGLKVSKLSGRGLGFTGGTIDKLEAIPGFKTTLKKESFLKQLQTIGAAISAQTSDLTPADGRFYALRDVTATVDSIPLIAASVVSKKIAVGAHIVVLDIKTGRGAFTKSIEEAHLLARMCREIGEKFGKTFYTVISSMEQPLGYAVGHSLEVEETIRTLEGRGPKDLEELCLTIGALALKGADRTSSMEEGKAELKELLHNGKALAMFRKLIVAQGGDPEVLESYKEMLPQPNRISMLPSPTKGYVLDIDPMIISKVVKESGGGRVCKEDPINLGVGVLLHKKIGDPVEKGETVVELYADDDHYRDAMDMLQTAFTYSETPVTAMPKLIHEIYPDF